MADLSRRDVLHGLSLATMAVAAASLLGACGGDSGPRTTEQEPGLKLVSSRVERSHGDDADVATVVTGMHHLGAGLYGLLAARPGNLAVSPFSIAVALGLTVNGAKGATADQMLDVLGSSDVTSLDAGLNALTSYVDGLAGPVKDSKKKEEVILASANGLFAQSGVSWDSAFLDTLARSFGTGIHEVDWKHATEAARTAVNAWTAARTHDKIPEILSKDAVTSDTRFALINTLYFKAPWDMPFDLLGSPETFTLADGTTVPVPAMSTELTAPYVIGDGFAAADVPYAGGDLAMALLLPDVGRIDDLEERVGAGGLPAILAALHDGRVRVQVPTWTFRSEFPLADRLASLGMSLAFDPERADFRGMTTEIPIYLSGVYHQVYVDVDEVGTEAAAATAVVGSEASSAQIPEYDLDLKIDRPYLFVIHDTAHGTPLFLGRVADPRG